MLKNDLNEFMDNMYHNPEKRLFVVVKNIWLPLLWIKNVNYLH